jgi:hypothetical protein
MSWLDIFRPKPKYKPPSVVGAKPKHDYRRATYASNMPTTIGDFIPDDKHNLRSAYKTLRDTLPAVGAAVAEWVIDIAGRQSVEFIGGSPRQIKRAEQAIEELDKRVTEYDTFGGGMNQLIIEFYYDWWTFGRWAAEMIPFPDGHGIDYVADIDPFTIKFKKNTNGRPSAVQETPDLEEVEMPEGRFIYVPQPGNKPYGLGRMDSIPFVASIMNSLVIDMGKSHHNAGVPRLHVKISPPERHPTETDAKFVSRMKDTLQSVASEFQELSADENIVSWDTVTVEVVEPKTADREWSMSLRELREDVIAAMLSFPYRLGYSHKATQNWIGGQAAIRLNAKKTVQLYGKRLAEKIRNTHLALAGIPVRCEHHFLEGHNPNALQQRQSDNMYAKLIMDLMQRMPDYMPEDKAERLLSNIQSF